MNIRTQELQIKRATVKAVVAVAHPNSLILIRWEGPDSLAWQTLEESEGSNHYLIDSPWFDGLPKETGLFLFVGELHSEVYGVGPETEAVPFLKGRWRKLGFTEMMRVQTGCQDIDGWTIPEPGATIQG